MKDRNKRRFNSKSESSYSDAQAKESLDNNRSSNQHRGHTLIFDDGSIQFRLRLVVSILSHRPLLMRNIRSDDVEAPGLREHEASFLRLLDRMTNGSVVEINSTGTQLRFKPGVLVGGAIEHFCPINSTTTFISGQDSSETLPRSIGWFLEGVLPLACFGKEPLHLTLHGITDGMCMYDPSVDYIKTSILPTLTRFGIGTNEDYGPPPSIIVLQRFALGTTIESSSIISDSSKGGCVRFYCPTVKELTPIDFTDTGKFKRVRGTVISLRIPPSSAARVAHSTKGLLHRLLPDVWIHTDAHTSRGNKQGVLSSGPNPSLSICLAAESTSGVILAAETCLDARKQRAARNGGISVDMDPSFTSTDADVTEKQSPSDFMLPEDLGLHGAARLLEEVRRGGCICTSAQSIAFLLMCLCPEDVSRIRIGKLSSYSVSSLRLFKTAFGVEFKIKTDVETKTVLMSCLGSGYRNMAKASA